MQIKSTNPCTRCGKERVSGESYTEEISTFLGTSTVVHTDTVCPDPECQKIVEEKLATQKAKNEEIKQKKLEVAENNKRRTAFTAVKN